MIFKELDPFSGSDKFAIAGRRAEEQMAHYLKRFFGSSPDVDVLNYLRIDLNGEVAQMDHLVLHPYGLTIVESKSVAGSVQIKDDGQWIRWFDKKPQGMRSPVIQAKMQSMLLKELLSRTVKQKGFFDNIELEVLVAISDSGTIQWPASGPLEEVCKADQVPERILAKLARSKSEGIPTLLSVQHRQVISQFLSTVHQPLERAAPVAPPPAAGSVSASVPVAVTEPSGPSNASLTPTDTQVAAGQQLPAKCCKHCGRTDLEAQYGKFGYYFLCKACEKNTSIKFSCPKCGEDGRVRKHGKEFFAECRSCDASALYHTNS